VVYGNVEKVKHDDINYFFVSSEDNKSDQSTLILRGASPSTLDEVARGFDDALGVVSMIMNGGQMVYGGGSTYVSMANYLRNNSASVEGRGQMAINAFADALEIIPATIAENAGHDPLDCLLSLRHAISEGRIEYGPDVENGGITSMQDLGVVEPLDLVKQAILSATEVTSAILKIDDIIAKRAE
jgi:chaperonin GroEL (HSP60 family)